MAMKKTTTTSTLQSDTSYSLSSTDSELSSIAQNPYDTMIQIDKLDILRTSKIRKRAEESKSSIRFYMKIQTMFEGSKNMSLLTSFILNCHRYILLECAFDSSAFCMLCCLFDILQKNEVIDGVNKKKLMSIWTKTTVDGVTLFSKWDRMLRHIRQNIVRFQLQQILSPHPHIFGHSPAPYSQQIYKSCISSRIEVSDKMYNTCYVQKECYEWMSFKKEVNDECHQWSQIDLFTGPFENVVTLRNKLVNYIMRLSIAIENVNDPSTPAAIAYRELAHLDHRTDRSWVQNAVKYINKYSFDLQSQLHDSISDLFDEAREVVDSFDDYLLQLHMAGLVIPNEQCNHSMSSLLPLLFTDLIVDFNKSSLNENGEETFITKTSQEFIRDLKYDYLAWYHSVNRFISV